MRLAHGCGSVVLTVFLSGLVFASADLPQDPDARAALLRYEAAVERANRIHRNAVVHAKTMLVQQLEAAQRRAMSRHDLAEANRLQVRIDTVKSEIAAIAAGAIDVLAMIDLSRDAKSGAWHWDQGRLVGTQDSGWAAIWLPYQPRGDFDLTVNFVRLSETGGIGFYVKREGRRVGFFHIGERLVTNARLRNQDGRRSLARTDHPYRPIETGQVHTFLVQVRSGVVSASLDEVPLIYEELDLTATAGVPDQPPLNYIGFAEGTFRIETIEIIVR